MQRQVVILGAGGFATELYDWLMSDTTINVRGFYSDSDRRETLLNLPIYKDLEIIKNIPYYLAVGDPTLKYMLNDRAKSHNMRPSKAFVHSSAIVGSQNVLEDGVIICPKVVITNGTHIKEHVLVNLNCTIGHGSYIGQFTTISPGANISGDVRLGNFNYVGTNATIREKVITTHNVTIGMSAVVVKDLNHPGVYIGNPLRKL